MTYKTVKIEDILTSPSTNSGLKKIHVLHEKPETGDYLPVYSASKNEKAIFGWVKKESKWKRYNNLLTWNKDGSAGVVFFREKEFVPYEKVKLLKIKSDFEKELFYPFLKTIIKKRLLSSGYNFGFKCSMERVLKIEIEIPVLSNGKFDIKEQKKLSEKYEKFSQLRNN